jgi:MOSC domain-containing protein YiiM
LTSLAEVLAEADRGLTGDHYSKQGGKRQVTLIQAEHLQALSSLTGLPLVTPGTVRRNLVVSGINLLALKGKRFRIGEALLEHTGLCHPCSQMEKVLGPGGYNAMRGHGGITAAVLGSGKIRVGDTVQTVPRQVDS